MPQTSNLDSAKPRTDKWEGQDEDTDVKDSWDKDIEDEDTSKGSENSSSIKAVVQGKKKKKTNKIKAEKKVAKLEEEDYSIKVGLKVYR